MHDHCPMVLLTQVVDCIMMSNDQCTHSTAKDINKKQQAHENRHLPIVSRSF